MGWSEEISEMKMQIVEQGGINWTWFKVRNGNLVAVFRLHYGESQLIAFREFEEGMIKVKDIKVPWAPWREECDIVADHTSRQGGYSTPEVIRAFGWLNEIFRMVAPPFEREECSEDIMRHLEYHGVTICRLGAKVG